jgi:hypothetical protein
MSRLSFIFLIFTSLMLTAYFGAAAWRLSDDSEKDITGALAPVQHSGWKAIPAQ